MRNLVCMELRKALRNGWFFAAFVTAGCSIAIPLVLNYLAVACFMPAYVPDPGEGLSVPIEEHYPFSALFFTCPLAYAVLYTVLDFFLCGSWAVVVCSASFFVRNRVVLLVGSHVIQYFLRYCNTTGVAERLFGTAGAYQLSLISMAWPVPSGDVPHAGIAVALGCAGLALALIALRVARRRDVVRERSRAFSFLICAKGFSQRVPALRSYSRSSSRTRCCSIRLLATSRFLWRIWSSTCSAA